MGTKFLADLFCLKGKTFLVSGGAGLLGSQISEALAEHGATVLIASRNLEQCKAKAGELETTFNTKSEGYQVDITDSKSIEVLFEKLKLDGYQLSGLINSSGFGKKNTWETISEEDWTYDLDVSLTGPFRMTKAAFSDLKETQGVVLNIASMYGIVAPDHRMYDGKKYANPPSYNAAKGGLLQFNRYLASFLSPHGIRVNAISPGPFPYESTQKENPNFIDRLAEKNPLNRIGIPYELKGAAILLCSDASSYITGQNLSIDGGWTIW